MWYPALVADEARRAEIELPRWSLGALEALHAAVLGAAGAVLPFRGWTTFAVGCFGLAVLHAAAAVLALVGHPRRGLAWRIQSFASLALLGVLTVALLRSGIYIATLYGGLGRGVAAALAAGWALGVLFTLPLACWGIAATGGVRWRRRATTPAVLGVLVVGGAIASMYQARALAAAMPVATAAMDDDTFARALAPVVGAWKALPPAPADAPSLLIRAPVVCPSPPGLGRPTWIATYLSRAGDRASAKSRCIQPTTSDELGPGLAGALGEDGVAGPVVVDQVEAVQRLPALSPILEALALRPGLDGVCAGATCLMPWQLAADGQFGKFHPVPSVPDLRYGVSRDALRRALGDWSEATSVDGLTRIVTRTAVLDAHGGLHVLRRLRRRESSPDEGTLDAASRAAEEFILSAQIPDGRFLYTLDPFTGAASFEGFAVARQAGTTAALCELGEPSDRLRGAAASSLKMLAALEWRKDRLGALVYPAGDVTQPLRLGPSALGVVAFLACRPRFGHRFDDQIGRLARFVLTMQRPDGGFHPHLDAASANPIPGPSPMYAEGEAVLGLVLLEQEMFRDASSRFPKADEVSAAIDRSMDHFGSHYWNHLERDLFFVEESWHCLAARAALAHHRNPAYERFCLDYVAFKSRLVLDERSGVAPELVGGVGFGNVLPPESTPTASFGEAVAAAIEVKLARGEDVTADRATLRRMLGFLLRQQWDDASCFACAASPRVPGAFSEQFAAPTIRIDYVQHAWAALEHGAHALGAGR